MTAITSTTTTETGPHSTTPWIVTSSPTFRQLSANSTNNTQTITSYRSPHTNLRGLIVRTDEPICSLHIILSTESNGGKDSWHHPDDGLPHTLEHLVFLGSLTHPHKGILDKLANRCMASGTNAWTATDHTAYTLSTAGGEGMLNLLPIFADHVLFPTLTEEGFVTEVHCVNGKGEDKGVVYCEMQGRENSEGSLIDRAVMDLLYPTDKAKNISSGYSAETGGKMANLRTLDIHKIRRYHREYYRSDNTLLLVTGNVESGEFLNKLDEVEALVLKRRAEGIPDNGDVDRVGRPWINSFVPVMEPNVTGVYPPYSSGDSAAAAKPLVINFPSEDESRGSISIAWRGPPYHARSIWTHLSLLWDYLTESAASPLQLAFVENDDPICAYVGPAHDVFTEGYHQVWFSECDVDKMKEVVPLFYDVMAKQAEVGQSEGDESHFDVARMRTVIRRYRRRLLEASERRPTDAIVNGIVRNFLYGPRAGEEKECCAEDNTPEDEMAALHKDTDVLPFLDEAETKLDDASYWQDLIKRYVLDRPMAVVLGKPSAVMATELSNKEKEREAEQAKNLGEEGLKKVADILEAAMAKNESPIPEQILTSLPVPDLNKVPLIPLFTCRGTPGSLSLDVIPESVRGVSTEDVNAIVTRLKSEAEESQLTNAPFHADLTHIESAFVFAAVGVDTTPLTSEQRLYLPILDEILFKLPATLDDGKHITKEEFVNQIHDETVSFSCGVGLLGGSIPQMAYVSVQTDNTDGNGLQTALKWIKRVLYQTEITGEAVKTAVQRLISEIPPQIRDGPSVASTVASELLFDSEKSNTVACSLIHQKPFLAKMFEKIGGKIDDEDMEEEGDTLEEGESTPVDDSGVQDIVKALENIRKVLFQTTNYHAFVAANLNKIPDVMASVVSSLCRTTDTSTPGRLIDNVSASSVRKSSLTSEVGRGRVVGLSAIESGFLNVITNGIKPYDPNRPALLVAIEYLTALEGDFWVKLRGAGLTYSYSISDSTDSELLKFGLFKCTDVPAAFEKASEIIADYASGKLKISEISLENAKASLAYQIISGRSSKLRAATSSFVQTFKGEKMDYDRYLLSGIASVTADDVIHALITYLVPCFDPSSNLVITCPPNKLDAIHDYFVGRGWTNLKKVPEEKLFEAFLETDSEEKNEAVLPDKVAGMSMFLPGAFAAQFRCSCPRCDK